eukprot:4326716-Pyramimonas_sp.AAC.1
MTKDDAPWRTQKKSWDYRGCGFLNFQFRSQCRECGDRAPAAILQAQKKQAQQIQSGGGGPKSGPNRWLQGPPKLGGKGGAPAADPSGLS